MWFSRRCGSLTGLGRQLGTEATMSVTERLRDHRFELFYAAMAAMGCFLVVSGVASLVTGSSIGGVALMSVLEVVAGVGLVGTSVWEIRTRDRAEWEAEVGDSRFLVWAVIAAGAAFAGMIVYGVASLA